MTSHSISNLRSIYITNEPYRYPLPYLKKHMDEWSQTGDFLQPINTGWHILPNLLWGHLATPRQWWEMVQKFQAISVQSITTRLFNPIPIQTALSFQGTNTFPAFNNTVYAMTYTDDIYETPWFPWSFNIYPGPINMFYEWNPAFKEGLIYKQRTDKYDIANDCAKDRNQLETNTERYPKWYPTQITANMPASYPKDTYRRQQLPIYWYHIPFPQYGRFSKMTNWNELLTYFEESFIDPSGTFWDPLNRPDHIGELRPGKNMVEYSWHVADTDQGIWFNTDRLAFPPPYSRPRPLQVPEGRLNRTASPRPVDPITPGKKIEHYKFLYNCGLLKQGDDRTVPEEEMAPEGMTGLPNWRQFPVVPMRWFQKEIQQSNPWAYEDIQKTYYRETVSGCPQVSPTPGTGVKKGDVNIQGPLEDIKFVGTEYEMYKYPPTQWFIKGVPLYDAQENHIKVEMQMFMMTTVTVLGKPRKSAIYGPTWGPINNQDLYSINMDTTFGENYIRGRSAGARRTWYDPENPRPTTMPNMYDIQLFPGDGGDQQRFPYDAKFQCIHNPATGVAHTLAWPKLSKYANADGLYVRTDPATGKRDVKRYEPY